MVGEELVLGGCQTVNITQLLSKLKPEGFILREVRNSGLNITNECKAWDHSFLASKECMNLVFNFLMAK